MVNLPVSVVWIFLFVNLIRGQVLDNVHLDNSTTLDEESVNGTEVNEDGRENGELETKKEVVLEPKAVDEEKERRRRVNYRPDEEGHPQMSPERRKSYLSIAERRKYYNRTRTKKPESSQRDVLLYQETTNRPTVPHERMLLMNEIRENRQKEKAVNQRLNETLPKPDNVTQTVIYPHVVEFGLKLRGRAQDKSRRRKTKEELTALNSTNNIGKGIQTQSTKLVRVDESQWSTTKNPEAENLVMPWKKNKTNLEKTAKYIKNASEKVLPVLLSYEDVHPFTATEAEENDATTDSADLSSSSLSPITTLTVTTTAAAATTSISSSTPTTATAKAPPSTPTYDEPTTWSLSTSAPTPTTTVKPPYRKLYIPSIEYKARFNYTRRPTFKPTNGQGHNNRTIFTLDRMKTLSPPYQKWRPSSMTVTIGESPSTESVSSTEKYPLTIEINENNKRVLSEMFRTTEAVLASKPPSTSESVPPPKDNEVKSAGTDFRAESVTSGSTTASSNGLEARDLDEDHKPVGTSFNTKFYIIPNVTKTEVIKIVEREEDAENEVLVTAQTVGIAIYILAAFGLVPLLLALVFGTKFFLQRHRRKDDCDSDLRSDVSDGRQGKGPSELKKSPSNVTTTTLVATTRLPRVHHWDNYEKNKNWECPRSKLKLLTILGQGNFGQVWKAEAEDMPGHEGMARLVAVKTVKEGATEKEHGELIKELEIMQQIGSHPNIVTLLGCCTDQEPYYLIMEYVMYGKLLTYLREHRTNENYYNISNNNDALTSRDLTVFAYCVARGMEYLASKGIIHRDLAARNVLVDHNKLCKIADFGMSRSVRDSENGQLYEERQHKGALPIRWMAPESLLYSLFTHKSDVWSFGIALWEIVTLGSTPYPNMGAREVMRRVREGYRLERPLHCRLELYQLISRCWAHDPNKRPDFGELRRELARFLDDTSKDGIYVDLDSFAVSNRFHISGGKTNDFRLLERNEVKTMRRVDEWEGQDWPMESRKARSKRARNNGKGTVTLTGHGSFTVNSRILEKEFKLV